MTEWLFTFALIVFPSPNDAVVAQGFAAVVDSEKTCMEAMAHAKEKYKGQAFFISCDPIKPGIPVECKRGSRI